jgi:propionyl-CoA carboxylase alpha chain
VREAGAALEVRVGEATHAVRVVEAAEDALRLEVDGHLQAVRVARTRRGPVEDGETLYLHLGDGEAMVTLVPRFPAPAGLADDPGSCAAPTPGVVRAVHVEVGQEVAAGQALVTLEAMKMEHQLKAPAAGRVVSVRATVGQSVDAGALLVVLETTDA